MDLQVVKKLTPKWVLNNIPKSIRKIVQGENRWRKLPSFAYLEGLMSNFQVKDLVDTDAATFKSRIDDFLRLRDHEMEGFADPEKQRDLTIQFHWGHDHDFGDFKLDGLMGNRHIFLPAVFIDEFKVLPKSLEGKTILDVGCWTGGTSMLLSKMGAKVVAIEEVKKYVDSLNYLKEVFDIKNIETKNLSVYECAGEEFHDAFDYALFAGVLYHVTDLPLILRIMFNCVRDQGYVLIETAAINSDKKMLAYEGPNVYGAGRKEDLSRSGWNWFLPSPSALEQMMADVGFTNIEVGKVINGRIFAVGRRDRHVDMMRGGLSVKTIR